MGSHTTREPYNDTWGLDATDPTSGHWHITQQTQIATAIKRPRYLRMEKMDGIRGKCVISAASNPDGSLIIHSVNYDTSVTGVNTATLIDLDALTGREYINIDGDVHGLENRYVDICGCIVWDDDADELIPGGSRAYALGSNSSTGGKTEGVDIFKWQINGACFYSADGWDGTTHYWWWKDVSSAIPGADYHLIGRIYLDSAGHRFVFKWECDTGNTIHFYAIAWDLTLTCSQKYEVS